VAQVPLHALPSRVPSVGVRVCGPKTHVQTLSWAAIAVGNRRMLCEHRTYMSSMDLDLDLDVDLVIRKGDGCSCKAASTMSRGYIRRTETAVGDRQDKARQSKARLVHHL
jgi:hypothetical protein